MTATTPQTFANLRAHVKQIGVIAAVSIAFGRLGDVTTSSLLDKVGHSFTNLAARGDLTPDDIHSTGVVMAEATVELARVYGLPGLELLATALDVVAENEDQLLRTYAASVPFYEGRSTVN